MGARERDTKAERKPLVRTFSLAPTNSKRLLRRLGTEMSVVSLSVWFKCQCFLPYKFCLGLCIKIILRGENFNKKRKGKEKKNKTKNDSVKTSLLKY